MVISPTFALRTTADYQLLLISSPAFSQNGIIPHRYSGDGMNISPGLNLRNIPNRTQSLAIVVDDPDAIHGHCIHWVAWNIPVTQQVMEGCAGGVNGLNDYGHHAYMGPCTKSDVHRYYFIVYALDCFLDILDSSGIRQLEKAMKDHILGFGILAGKYTGVKAYSAAVLQANY